MKLSRVVFLLGCFDFFLSYSKQDHSTIEQFARTSLARYYGLQERGQRWYTDVEKEDVFKTSMKFCQRYVALAKNAMRTVALKHF